MNNSCKHHLRARVIKVGSMRQILKLQIILLALVITIGLVVLPFYGDSTDAATEDIEVDNLSYTIDTEAHTAIVNGYVSSPMSTEDLVIPAAIVYNETDYTVVSIAPNAFEGCSTLAAVDLTHINTVGTDAFKDSSITSLTAPASITWTDSAFSGCTSLTSIVFTGSGTVAGYTDSTYQMTPWYENRTNIITFTIPDTITGIGDYTFAYQTKMVSLPVMNGVTNIGQNAFFHSGLASIVIPATVTTIGESAFAYCTNAGSVSIGNGITDVGADAFSECTSITSLTVPAGYLWSASAFSGSVSITDINLTGTGSTANYTSENYGNTPWYENRGHSISFTLSTTITSIGDYIFADQSKMTSTPSLATVTRIGSHSFSNSGITTISVPEGVAYIGTNAFSGCTNLASLTITNDTEIDTNAFSGCTKLTGLVVPANKAWSVSAFHGCTRLANITFTGSGGICGYTNSTYQFTPWYENRANINSLIIPETVTSIGAYAFPGLLGLTTTPVIAGVTNIGAHAFDGCTGLTSVILPSTLTTVGERVFDGCNNISSITIPVTLRMTAGLFTSSSVSSVTFVGSGEMPDYTAETYTATPWYLSRSLSPVFGGLDGITHIGDYTFKDQNLNLFPIGISVESFGDYCFANSGGPSSIEFLEVSDYFGAYSFSNTNLTSLTISGTATVMTGAFSDCTQLTTLTIPASQNWAYSSFKGCTALNSIIFTGPGNITGYTAETYKNTPWYDCRENSLSFTIPNTVTSIGDYAFTNQTGLTALPVMEGVTSIGVGAFKNTGIAALTIPSASMMIADNAFSGCVSLTHLTVPSDKVWGRSAFSGCTALSQITFTGSGTLVGYTDSTYQNTPWYDCRANAPTFTLPSTITAIGNFVFADQAGMSALPAMEGVTSIGIGAFKNTGLTSVTLTATIDSVGADAFSACTSLTALSVPVALVWGASAFSGCTALAEIELTGSGEMTDYTSVNYRYTPWYDNKANSLSISISDAVISIGDYAFADQTNMVSLPAMVGVTSIGTYAFSDTGLNSVALSDKIESVGPYAFSGSNDITEISVPATLNLSENIFSTAVLTRITFTGGGNMPDYTAETYVRTPWFINKGAGLIVEISNQVEYIGDYTFYGQILTSFTVPESVTGVGQYCFYGATLPSTLVLSENLVSINSYAFAHSTVSEVSILGIANVGAHAFDNCDSLTSISVNGSITWTVAAFMECSMLSTVIILGDEEITGYDSETYMFTPWYLCQPSTVLIQSSVSVGNYAFYGCNGIRNITVSAQTTYAENSFTGCTNIINVTLTGSGSTADFTSVSCTYTPWYTSRTHSISFTVSENISIIGDYFFTDQIYLTAIPAMPGLTNIGQASFKNTGLNAISLNNITSIGNSAFSSCSALTSVSDASDLNAIPAYAFEGCIRLADFDFSNILTIGDYAFIACTSIDSIDLSHVYSVGVEAFRGSGITSLTLDSGLTVGNRAFSDCIHLETLSIPCNFDWSQNPFGSNSNLLTIIITDDGSHVLSPEGYYNLTPWFVNNNNPLSIVLPDTLTTLGDYALKDCNGLVSVNTTNVTSFGAFALAGCTSLDTLDLSSMISAGDYAFYLCTAAKTLLIPATFPIGENTFSGCTSITSVELVGTGEGSDYTSETYMRTPWYISRNNTLSVTISSGITGIGDYMFYGCIGLTSLELPSTVQEIGISAFAYTKITSLVITENITINTNAFAGCDELENLTVPIDLVWNAAAFPTCIQLSTIMITGEGESPSYETTYLYTPWYLNRTNVINVTVSENITSIGAYMFYGCAGLTDIDMDVTSVGDYAFYGCTSFNESLSNIQTIGTHAFNSCNAITVLDLSSAMNIGDYAFSNCSGITSLMIRAELTITQNMFSLGAGNNHLSLVRITGNGSMADYTEVTSAYLPWKLSDVIDITVTIDDTVTRIGDYAFCGMASITTMPMGNGITTIGSHAFDGTGITSIDLPANITSIETGAFSNCTNLVNVISLGGTISLAQSLFEGCTNLEVIDLNSFQEIGDNTFKGCSELSSVDLTHVRLIGANAFQDCAAIDTVAITADVMSVGEDAFKNCSGVITIIVPAQYVWTAPSFSGCTSLVNVIITGSGTIISQQNYQYTPWYLNRTNPLTIELSEEINGIGNDIFHGCTGLTSINFTRIVTIGDGAFAESGLVSVTLNNNTVSVGADAFAGCVSLSELSAPASLLWTQSAFSGTPLDTIHFTGSGTIVGYALETYASTPWYDNRARNLEFIIDDGINTIGDYVFKDQANMAALPQGNSITTYGAFSFAGCTSITTADLSQIVNLGTGAFKDCTELTSVTLPNSMVSISDSAFEGCEKLVNIDMAAITHVGANAFKGCVAMGVITLPVATMIDDGAFENCSSVTTANTPEAGYIGDNAFKGCSQLTQISMDKATTIGTSAFEGCVVLESIDLPIVTSVGEYTFKDCSSVTELTIPAQIQFGSETFKGCTGLITVILIGDGPMADYSADAEAANYYQNTPWYISRANALNVTISDGVTSVGEYAFMDCTGLTSVIGLASVTTIPQNVFMNCSALTVIGLSNITSVGSNAFSGCSSLQIADLRSVTSIENYAFQNCSGIKELVLPASIATGQLMFPGCTGLTSVSFSGSGDLTGYTSTTCVYTPWYLSRTNDIDFSISSDITSVGAYVFYNQINMTALPDMPSVTTIGAYAFSGCTSLLSADLSNVTSLDNNAFAGCSGLSTLTVPVTLDYSLRQFEGCTGITNLTLMGTGAMTDYSPSSVTFTPWYQSRASLSIVTIGSGVTSIGAYTFLNQEGMTELYIGENVSEIGRNAFENSGVTALTLSDKVTSIGNYAFKGCIHLSTMISNGSITAIPEGAFNGCTSLSEADLTGVTSIGAAAFSGCTSLYQVNLSDITYIGTNAFVDCSGIEILVIPASLSASGGIFAGCTGLRNVIFVGTADMANYTSTTYTTTPWYLSRANGVSVTIEEGVKTIGNYAFSGMELAAIPIASTVTKIGESAFANCGSLLEADLTNITYLGSNAFSSCSGLKTLIIPATLKVSGNMFAGCTGLTRVNFVGSGDMADYTGTDYNQTPWYLSSNNIIEFTISPDITSIGNFTFYSQFRLINLPMGEGVTSIGICAFDGCTSLEEISLPDNVSILEGAAFRNCNKLSSVLSLGSVTAISNDAFSGCVLLNNIDLSSVKTIGQSSFSGCTALIDCDLTSISSVGSAAFQNCTGLRTLVIPATFDITNDMFTGCTGLTTVNFVGQGAIPDYTVQDLNNLPWYLSRENTLTITLSNGITRVGDYVFYGLTGLGSMPYGAGVTTVGNYAFSGCTSMMNADLLGITSIGIHAFENTNISTVSISSGTTVGSYSFSGCTGLATASWNIDTVPAYCFNGCTSLTSINLGELKTVGDFAFDGCISLPTADLRNITALGTDAFGNCTALRTLVLPTTYVFTSADIFENDVNIEDVSFIGTGDLPDYSELSCIYTPWYISTVSEIHITLNDEITHIGDYIFKDIENLKHITLYQSIQSVGEGSFMGCTALSSIDFPNSVTSMGVGAFKDCTSLATVSLSEGIAVVPAHAFDNCTSLTGLDLINITGIESYAFFNCSELIVVDLSHITTIGAHAFDGCVKLSNVNLSSINAESNNESSLGEYAFNNCFGILSLTINAGFTVEQYRFPGCNGLTTVNFVGVGNMADYTISTYVNTPWYISRSNTISFTIGNGITSIGAYAFKDQLSILASLDGEGVIKIGAHAFDRCTNMTSAIIQEKIVSIGESAFEGCSNLTSLTAPIGFKWQVSTFKNTGLTTVNFTGTGAMVDYTSEDYTFTPWYENSANNSPNGLIFNIPETVTGIGDYTFRGQSQMQTLPAFSGITAIGSYAFYATGLTSVTIPSNIEYVGIGAFGGCDSLSTLNVPIAFKWQRNAFPNDSQLSTVVFTGSGAMVDYTSEDYTFTPWYDNRNNDLVFTIPGTVTRVGNYTFAGQTQMSAIPELLGDIELGDYSFTSTGIIALTIPDKVKSVGTGAFSQCVNMVSINVPLTLEWTVSAFNGTSKINSVTFNGEGNMPDYTQETYNVTPWYENRSNNIAFTVSGNPTHIGAFVFAGQPNLTSFEIPASVTNLNPLAFADCYALAGLTVADGNTSYSASNGLVTSIDGTTLVLCTPALSGKLTIPQGIARVGPYAIYNCSKITAMVIPSSVTELETNAISGCNALTSLTVPASLEFNDRDMICNTLQDVTITGSGKMTDYNSASYKYTPWNQSSASPVSLGAIDAPSSAPFTTVTLSDGITYLGAYSFYGCKAMSNIILPKTLEEIGAYCFTSCRSLPSTLEFPESLTTVGAHAFEGCSSISFMIFDGTLPIAGQNAFKLDGGNTLTVISKDDTVSFTAAALGGTSASYYTAETYDQYLKRLELIDTITSHMYLMLIVPILLILAVAIIRRGARSKYSLIEET